MKKWCQKTFIFILKFPMNTTAKILLAHYFPNIILFKISNRINLNFGVTIVALDLKLLRKNKIGLPITTSQFQNEEKCLDIFWADGRCKNL